MIKGIVALVGRPNVGKSTLFNRLTRARNAIVDDRPGVTRDRLYGVVEHYDDDEQSYMLVDTGGFETKEINYQPFKDNLVWEQTEYAIDEADLIVMMLDAKAGLHPHDAVLVRHLHKKEKNIIFVVNKVDGLEQQHLSYDFYQLGVDELHCMSSAHSRGVGELCEMIEEKLASDPGLQKRKGVEEGAVGIALIGRPNVGKSSILNRLLGENRALVSEIAGTTRDSVDTPYVYNNRKYVLIDTAGIRRKSKVSDKLESLSVLKSLRSMERADTVLLILDAVEGLTEQDAKLASLAVTQHKPLLIVVNKWDLIEDKETNTAKEFAEDIRHEIKAHAFVPVKFISCLENKRVFKLFTEVEKLQDAYNRRVGTAELNEVLDKIVHEHTPALIRNHTKRVKFYYATQVKTCPPTFVVMCNLADQIQESYKRYMTHRFRKLLGFENIPLNIIFRGKVEATKKRGKVPLFMQGRS